jgi:DNA processing protein
VGGVTVDAEVLLARVYLNRVAEPTCVPLWAAVRRDGPVATARAVRRRTAGAEVLAATEARARGADPEADLEAADRAGVRLVAPESPDWPHLGLACLEHTGVRRVAQYAAGDRARATYGEPIPPLVLWVKGTADLASLGVRSVAIVGARAATAYGQYVTGELASGLAGHGYTVVSGGAYGIDAAAHRAALAVEGATVLVSAGGLDRAYPSGHAELFDEVAATGLLVSESPPGAAPARQRFLTRNRLIAALSAGTVVVEAAVRSGALNTAGHCGRFGRPVMIVPGPVTSAASAGVHDYLFKNPETCRLVAGVDHVLEVTGAFTAAPPAPTFAPAVAAAPSADNAADPVRLLLDQLDDLGRAVYDGLPARRPVTVDELSITSSVSPREVMRALPVLEVVGLIARTGSEYRRVPRSAATKR